MKTFTLDALTSKVPCRYEVVSVITKRARGLVDNNGEKLEDKGEFKPVIQASMEFVDGLYTYHHEPDEK